MARKGKQYREARGKVESKLYPLEEALRTVRDASFAKFDETIEVSLRLGVNPKHADQMVRGTVILPHGLGGKSKRVLVIAGGEKAAEAEAAQKQAAAEAERREAETKLEKEWKDTPYTGYPALEAERRQPERVEHERRGGHGTGRGARVRQHEGGTDWID